MTFTDPSLPVGNVRKGVYLCMCVRRCVVHTCVEICGVHVCGEMCGMHVWEDVWCACV